MKIANKKFIKTPPIMISRRCQAGLERNSHWLSRLLHLLGIHRLVYHTRNFHIATQRHPANTIFRITVLRLEFEQRKPRVKEYVELLSLTLKRREKENVLMDNDHNENLIIELRARIKKCFHLVIIVL